MGLKYEETDTIFSMYLYWIEKANKITCSAMYTAYLPH